MKTLLFTALIAAGSITTHAQASADGEYYGDDASKIHVKAPTSDNAYANTTMTSGTQAITFSDLPDMPKPTWAIITNAQGESIRQARVSKDKNTVSIHNFQRGLYFVTLIYHNKSQKGFVLNVE